MLEALGPSLQGTEGEKTLSRSLDSAGLSPVLLTEGCHLLSSEITLVRTKLCTLFRVLCPLMKRSFYDVLSPRVNSDKG